MLTRGGNEAICMSTGPRTPEELETLLEDMLMTQNREALAGLFEDSALLVVDSGKEARGGVEIAGMALDTWHGEHAYVADPRKVMQARDIALIVTKEGVNVMRRGSDGAWRYVIAVLAVENAQEE